MKLKFRFDFNDPTLSMVEEDPYKLFIMTMIANYINFGDDGNGNTIFHIVHDESLDDVKPRLMKLLKLGFDINSKNIVGNTPLHIAACGFTVNYKYMKFLLENGADPKIKNRQGEIAENMISDERLYNILKNWEKYGKQ